MKDISAINPSDADQVRELLKDLIAALREKRGHDGKGLLPDEETVFSSLAHPERGDLVVTIAPEGSRLHVFISNRRDANSPFAVMASSDVRKFPGRRTLDGSRINPDREIVGMFLSSVQDQEFLRASAMERIDIYSVHFGIGDSTPAAGTGAPERAPDLSSKSVGQCTNQEKWQIYKDDRDMDNRVAVVEKELFGFPMVYSRYKQPEKEEILMMTPRKYEQIIGQLIRDMYPAGVKSSLKRDFPADHNKRIAECHEYIKRLIAAVRDKMKDSNGPDYNDFLVRLESHLSDILKFDTEFTQYI